MKQVVGDFLISFTISVKFDTVCKRGYQVFEWKKLLFSCYEHTYWLRVISSLLTFSPVLSGLL